MFEKRPYNTSEQTALFSLSKSFVAVAVLFAIQEWKIEEKQKLSEFFDDNG